MGRPYSEKERREFFAPRWLIYLHHNGNDFSYGMFQTSEGANQWITDNRSALGLSHDSVIRVVQLQIVRGIS